MHCEEKQREVIWLQYRLCWCNFCNRRWAARFLLCFTSHTDHFYLKVHTQILKICKPFIFSGSHLIDSAAGSPLAGKLFVVIGAGGAGKALAYGAKEKGARVVIANRTYG